MSWVGHAVYMGEIKFACILVRSPDGKSPLEAPKGRREYNIEIDLKCDAKAWPVFNWL
jgi:hypothetical protein